MGLQQLENEAKRILRELEEELEDDYQWRLNFCLTQDKMPKDKMLRRLVERLRNCIKVAKANGTLPTMPTDRWMQMHGTICQPLYYVDDDTPIPEPDSEKYRKKKPHIVKKVL